jgi:lipopolysaccharide biosynthesis protein
VLAHFSEDVHVSRSFRTMVGEFVEAGYLTLVVSASQVAEPLEWNGDLPSSVIVVRQPNLGYDFGSWAIGLDLLGDARRAPYLILANDSVVGPFTSLHPLLEQFEQTASDVWALTDTYQYFHHLQSYFLGFRNGILADRPLSRFFGGIRIEATKWDIIRRNELGLNKLLHDEGYSTVSAFRANTIVTSGENPVIRGWWKLLANGYPFVKREIVRDPSIAPRSEFVAAEISAAYGQTLEEWL